MDVISLELKRIESSEELKLDGICFSRCVFVRVRINPSFDSFNAFPDSLPIFSELIRSLDGSGHYLLFSCACGVADDGGWDYVHVTHNELAVTWRFNHDREYSFAFEKALYRKAIINLADQIDLLGLDMPLEPISVVYPEGETIF